LGSYYIFLSRIKIYQDSNYSGIYGNFIDLLKTVIFWKNY